jgi:hypothetical protein
MPKLPNVTMVVAARELCHDLPVSSFVISYLSLTASADPQEGSP